MILPDLKLDIQRIGNPLKIKGCVKPILEEISAI